MTRSRWKPSSVNFPLRGQSQMWLTLGRDCAGADESWVKPVYDNAFKRASDDERAVALVL